MPILRMPEVKAETGHRSHASVYTAVHDGLFTVPVPIGQRAVGWPDHEVKAINAAGGFGRWTWDVAFKPGEVQDIISKHAAVVEPAE